MTTDVCVMKWSVVGRVLVMCASGGQVSDETFNSFLEHVRSADVDSTLALGLGSAKMSVIQRTDAARLLKEKGLKAVTLTDSRVVRGIMTAMSWFGGNVQSFPLAQIEAGLDCLQLSGDARLAVRSEAENLRARVEQELQFHRTG